MLESSELGYHPQLFPVLQSKARQPRSLYSPKKQRHTTHHRQGTKETKCCHLVVLDSGKLSPFLDSKWVDGLPPFF
ncbi:hypothetical protein K1719_030638 [Acacia pycnantha]|nr:hypothetical protein K1719_030638 [Acacia pycnantha]